MKLCSSDNHYTTAPHINDPYAQLRVPDVAKYMNIKVFNLMSGTNETRRCRLDEVFLMILNVGIVIYAGVNAKSCLIKVIAIVNLCDVGEYLDYANCKCRKRLIDKLMLECKDEKLNTTVTISIADKKVTCKNNGLSYIISSTIMYLILLTIVFISCYCYYTRHWLRKEYSVSY